MTILSNELERIIGFRGGNWAYFARNLKEIGAFIEANQLKPSQIGPISATRTTAATAKAKAIIDLGIRGGIRVPHLHYENNIYLLNQEQWAKFSHGIIAEARARLADVKEVSFEDAMVIASATEGLAKG